MERRSPPRLLASATCTASGPSTATMMEIPSPSAIAWLKWRCPLKASSRGCVPTRPLSRPQPRGYTICDVNDPDTIGDAGCGATRARRCTRSCACCAPTRRSRARLSAELLRTHGLTLNDYEVLLHLSFEDERKLRRVDLAERILLTASGITRLLDGLEQRRLRDEVELRHRRARHVRRADRRRPRRSSARPRARTSPASTPCSARA